METSLKLNKFIKNNEILKYIIIFLLIITIFPIQIQSSRILGLFTSPSKSHLIVYMPIAKILVERGHDVTVITSIPLPNDYNMNKLKNFHHIQVNATGISKEIIKNVINDNKDDKNLQKNFISFFKFYQNMIDTMLNSANSSMNDPQLIKLMNNEKFDLLLLGYFVNDFQLGLASHFKCPVIIIFMIQPVDMINSLIGNPAEISYVPNIFFCSGCKQPMSFIERLKNFSLRIVEMLGNIYFHYKMENYYVSNFPADKYPSYWEIRKIVSLVFVNHHFSQGPIRPNVPAIIEVGGLQIKEKPDPLPSDIKKFMDDDKGNGIIYFSLGSNVQSADLHSDKLQIIFNVLSKLSQKVIWKWENENIVPGKSSNIFYKKWLPQDDILAHKNIKLFITHGGLGSVMESKYHGVPMIGIPMFADQFANLNEVENNGYGICLNYHLLNENNLSNAINEILYNSTYKKNIENFSKLYKDRPLSNKDTVIFWTEYIIRHNGAKHLQSPIIHMNFIEYYLLDVFAILFISFYIIYKIFELIICKICSMLCKNNNEKKKSD